MKRILMASTLALALGGIASSSARADLKLCNNTQSSVSVAVGYKDKEGWASEGWWTAKPTACINLVKGPLIARFYYVFAVDREKGGSWGGKALICIKDKIFTIRGIDKCSDRGYQQQGFFEVDTGEKEDWTVSLSADKPLSAAPTATAPAPQATGDNAAQPVPIPDPTKPVAPAAGVNGTTNTN